MTLWSQLGHKTYKENPVDAEIPSHQLLVRAGMIKKLSPGIYTYGPLALKAMRKVEAIIRDEHDKVGAQELLMPMVQPKALWKESGRWGYPELLTLKNRNDHDFCLGATHEEVITDYVRNDITSYKEMPVILYQIQTKYRDEIRPRFGLMRGREFIMKDAYSFDESVEKAHESYAKMKKVYHNIFDRLGLDYRAVKADGGAIGGSLTEEFQVLAEVGEDELLVSDASDFAANVEICETAKVSCDFEEVKKVGSLEEFPTPDLKTIEDLAKSLNKEPAELVKTMFFEGLKNEKEFQFTVVLRGSDQVNLVKIKNNLCLDGEPRLLTDAEVEALTGASPGSCGPVGLKTPVYADHNLEEYKSMVVGANKDGFHLKGVSPGRDFEIERFFDLTIAKEGASSPDGKGSLKSIRGIEVGHIFYLGQKYSASMKASFLNQQGKACFFEMGCYGIGVGRTMQAAVEQSHDEDGIVWPRSITPFDIHVSLLDKTDEINTYVAKFSKEAEARGLSVFVDDRKERPGVKFKDADLLGFPVRIVIGKRGFNSDSIEVFDRRTKEKTEVSLEAAFKKVEDILC